ncbi:toxic anion resistance protein [Geobacillus sp. FSL K6-0789]|uniref:Toxic anion resistance protein n=1 Tax=Geobacillus stearothermophilus TaxID=1422 RepID=A0A3L7DC42_GEOSE|nr:MULTISPECIES: toxic anion resistance protein [Geobacillus]KMY58040.1 tellurite resistance protein TelA [Geobacillus stearothermophilus]KMY62719.1 tellurite resistance protein TelA [Geobacillus stearothermophilus]KOR94233.1 tellurite resistance protein TelA [Geobacillus stearothermophilus ATCC 12980]MBR2517227.1 toxic anion resistance protein [Geobacillus sp.]MED3720272.1 toxic anion resistance protein [Geobacillus stearothermophilus]
MTVDERNHEMESLEQLHERKRTSILDDLLAQPFSPPAAPQLEEGETTANALDALKPEHREKALALARQIDPANHQAILQYGVAAQAELSKFSHAILHHVQTKDAGPVGEVISELMAKIKEVNPDDLMTAKKGFLSRLFGTVAKPLQGMVAKYQKIGVEIDKIADQLEKHRHLLFRDIMMLETLYEKNKEYFEALNIYIAAAEYKLEELRTKTIPEKQAAAERSGDQMAWQEVQDLRQFADRLEKRVHDLKLSRQVTIQTAPQIRMIQHMNETLVERIQSSILNAIPLWKNQVVIALTLFRQQKAAEAQKQVAETTNELLLRNSELLKTNSIAIAKENERGLVDIETLKRTQENLIATLEETLKIQAEGRLKRQQAERELAAMEAELKQTLLSLKRPER